MGLLGVTNYDGCVQCDQVCSKCWREDKHHDFVPRFPLRLNGNQETVPNTYFRWAYSHIGVIRSFVRQNFNHEDWDPQTRWMLKHPHVAYHMIDNQTKENDVKIAKIVSWLWSLNFGVIPVLGGQQEGKTMTMLWLAEIMHSIKPKKAIVYFTKDKNLKHPEWMTLCDDLKEVPNGTLLIIDEGGLRAFAGDHMKTQQKWLVKLCAIVGHKQLVVLIATQSLNILGLNPIRLLTALIIKPISDVAKTFGERGLIEHLSRQIPLDVTETTIWNPRPPDKFIISFWQPMPRFPGHEEFRAAFALHDITREESLFKVRTLEKKEMKSQTCNVCGFVWRSRVERPARCPKCTSPKWDIPPQIDGKVSNYEQAEGETAQKPLQGI